jgi:hypothetical protein
MYFESLRASLKYAKICNNIMVDTSSCEGGATLGLLNFGVSNDGW